MARKGLEGFPERCKVLWLFFSCQREETARGGTPARPPVPTPTSVPPRGNELGDSGRLWGVTCHPPVGFASLKPLSGWAGEPGSRVSTAQPGLQHSAVCHPGNAHPRPQTAGSSPGQGAARSPHGGESAWVGLPWTPFHHRDATPGSPSGRALSLPIAPGPAGPRLVPAGEHRHQPRWKWGLPGVCHSHRPAAAPLSRPLRSTRVPSPPKARP